MRTCRHSQADTEQADLARERAELRSDDKGEHKELTAIYVGRGLDPSLAEQVADQLMAHDAIGAHARDELGMSETLRARPIKAALASASSFAVGAAMPLIVTAVVPAATLIIFVAGTSLLFLALLVRWPPAWAAQVSRRALYVSPSGGRLPWGRRQPSDSCLEPSYRWVATIDCEAIAHPTNRRNHPGGFRSSPTRQFPNGPVHGRRR